MDDTRAITIYHSTDICVFRQLGFWYDTTTKIHFIPTKAAGFVAVIAQGCDPKDSQPLFGYIVYRPTSIMLDFDSDVGWENKAVDRKTMREWCKRSLPWERIGKPRDNTRNTR